jgi:hypothetical protein
MAFPLRTAEGADVGASESLSHPVLLARHSKSENLLSRVVFPDPAVVRWHRPTVLDTPPSAPIDPTGRRCLFSSC